MKTKEELNAIKKEVEALNKKLAELTDEELEQVSGGVVEDHTHSCLEPIPRDPRLRDPFGRL